MMNLKANILDREVYSGEFTCGVKKIDEFVQSSYIENITQHAMAIEVTDNETIIGYCMINFKNIFLERMPEDIADYNADLIKYCTSAHIQYIAVDKSKQKKKYGTKIIAYVIKYILSFVEKLPIRLITLDAFKELVEWYKKIGFRIIGEEEDYSNEDTVAMYYDCLTKKNRNKLDNYELV